MNKRKILDSYFYINKVEFAGLQRSWFHGGLMNCTVVFGCYMLKESMTMKICLIVVWSTV